MYTHFEEWISTAVDDSLHFRGEFLRSHGWMVVPVESGCHFDDGDIEALAAGLHFAGKSSIKAVLGDSQAINAPSCVEVDATEEGLRDFNRQHGHLNYLLIPDDCSFALICTTNDYFLVGGQKPIVERLIGTSTESARHDFDEFARDSSWTESERSRLLYVAERYRGTGRNLEEGETD